MYRCQITGKLSHPGQPLNKVIAITREKTYTRRIQDEETRIWKDVVVAKGFEPVKELSLSLEGLTLWESWSPEERQVFLQRLNER